jgi:hypothetical protein
MWARFSTSANRSDARFVMPGLVPGIRVLLFRARKDVDGRDKPGHDVVGINRSDYDCAALQLQRRRHGHMIGRPR